MFKSSFNLILILPLMFNFIIIMIMMNQSNINKFHPLTLLMILISLTFFITLKMNFNFNSWLSFILFLTMIGGLMVIFLYISSLINNELLSINLKTLIYNFIKIFPLLMLMLIFMYLFNYLNYFNINPINLSKNLQLHNLKMNSMYMMLFNKSTIFLMIYLYYTMICIINICSYNKSPLRQMTF